MLRHSNLPGVLAGLLLLTALFAVTTCHAGKSYRVVYRPHPETKGAPSLSGDTWEQTGETYVIRLQKLTDDERLAYIQRMTGLATDPFTTKPGHEPRFYAFLLEVVNKSDGSINVNPFNCWLMPSNAKVRNPIGLTDLSFTYHMAGADLPPAYETVGEVLVDEPKVILAGRTFHGLLVYRALEKKPRSYRVDVQLTLPNGKVARFQAPYRRAKIEEPESQEP